MRNADMPAMLFEGGKNNGLQSFGGLSKRESFAKAALCLFKERIGEDNSAQIAFQCVKIADALLKELENEHT